MSKRFISGTIFLTILFSAGAVVSQTPPNPVLVFAGATPYVSQGANWTRYHYYVDNANDYPKALFAAAPELPPCGTNKNSSRTWVDLYEQTGKRLNGFCAITETKSLSDIWFNLQEGTTPPSWVYVELNDRKTNTKFKSNLAETVL